MSQRLSAAAILLVALFQIFAGFCHADVGTAAFYNRPYVPTACYGTSVVQIPANNLFAAVDDRIWDNGAACGRDYSVRCLSGATPPNPCLAGQTVTVRIVDRAPPVSTPSSAGTTFVLSNDAFSVIAKSADAKQINIEFLQ
ncbi:EG45-like domain containing protein [Nymphaea thermarum]|nr:EG45-like domain containing protein [Nymphaea thermarum]